MIKATLTCLIAFLALAWVAPAKAHLPKSKNPQVRLHHARTALLWIDKHENRFKSKRQLTNTREGHEWLFLASFDRLGYLDPFMCIFHKEKKPGQEWATNTGNGYYGGLQMDLDFQGTYGPEYLKRWGTANNWPSWAQLHAGYRAVVSGRGFGPWPNTRIGC